MAILIVRYIVEFNIWLPKSKFVILTHSHKNNDAFFNVF